MADDLDRYLEKQLADPGFRAMWDEGEAEYQARRAVIDARIAADMTQTQLAKASGVDQRVISRIETGGTNATVRTLGRIAQGLGKRLEIRFV
ncbi:helix-turn-helix transcriptional regulator [Rubneribacter badeniensis]